MATQNVTVTANKFDPNTQSFTSSTPTNQDVVPGTNYASTPSTYTQSQNDGLMNFNQSMVKGSTITSDSLKTPNIVPLATTKTPDYMATINSTVADLTNQQTAAQARVDASNQEAKNQASNVANLQSLLGGKSTDTQKIYNEQGVTTAYNQIQDINAQATGLKNEALAIPIQIQQEATNRDQTDAGVAPIQSARLRDNALKALSLGQQAAIANANYDKAKNYADLIVNAKYDQMDADIKAKLTNISAIKEFDLTPAEKKLADVTSKRLSYEQAQISEMKAKETAINELIVNAYKQDAPKSIVSKAEEIFRNGGDVKQVADALGGWSGSYYQNEALKKELTQKKISDLQTNMGAIPVGSITKELGITTDQYMQGIAGTESAGSIDAYGGNDPYKVISGQQSISDFNAMSQKEKENTAYGKYQVMGFNIPTWTEEAFGTPMTIEQFLASPEKQDALIKFRAEQDYAKYGNWDDVASVWFSGHPAAGNNRGDKFGTSTPTYITKYRKNMGITSDSNMALPEGAIKFNNQVVNLTKLQQSQYTDINNEINAAVKSDIGVISSFKNIEQTATLAKAGNPASQISLVFSYMKALDPTSTVREGEFATVQNAAGVPEQIRNQYNKVMSGNFLTSDQIDNIVAESKGRANIAQNNINSILVGAEARAKTFGLPGGLVSETIKTRIGSNTETPKSPEASMADDIFNMQQKVESTTPKYIIF